MKHWLDEVWFPVLLAALFIVAGSAPYVYGYQTTREGERYMGFVGRDVQGACGYFMLAKQAAEGHHRFENRYSPEPLPRRYFSLEWWLFGKTAKITGWPLLTVFHLGRVLTVLAFFLSAYYLIAVCVQNRGARRLVLSIVAAGSGLGWIIWLMRNLGGLPLAQPPDLLGVTVANMLVIKPHFIRALVFAALKYGLLIQGERSGRWRYFACSGIVAGAQTLIRPFHLPETILFLIAVPLLLNLRDGQWSSRRFVNYGLAFVTMLPAIVLYAWFTKGNPLGLQGFDIASGFNVQGWGQPQFFVMHVLWRGWPLIVCMVALRYLLQLYEAEPTRIMLVAWYFCMWIPYNLHPYWGAGHEASFPASVFVPPLLAVGWILPKWWATACERDWNRRVPAWIRQPAGFRALAVSLVLAGATTSAIVYVRNISLLDRPYPHTPYYVSNDLHEVMRWLNNNTPEESVVFASPNTSQYIPVVSHNKTVSGHYMFSPDYEENLKFIYAFYHQASPVVHLRERLEQLGVDYVVFSGFERAMGGKDPGNLAWCQPLFRHGEAELFRFEPQRRR